MSGRLAKLALVLGATVGTLLLLELGIRIARPAASEFFSAARLWGLFVEWDPVGQYHRGVPGGRLTASGIEYRFNSWGLRGPEPPGKKPPGTIRIVTLGDSVTDGSGVPDEDSFSGVLTTELSPRDVEVVRLSMGGWNTVQELNCLRRYIDVLEPDVVVLTYVINDTDPIDPWQIARRPPSTFASRLYRTLVVHSRLFEWAAWVYVTKTHTIDWEGLRIMRAKKERAKELGPAFAPTHPEWLASRAALGELVTLTRSHDATLVIYGWNMGSYPPGPVMLERLREFGAEHDVAVFDTAQLYTDEDPLYFWVLPFYDSHPNARAHRRYADYIVATLEDLGLIPKRAIGTDG